MDNDATLEILGRATITCARAGADLVAPYNDLAAVAALFDANPGQVAAVIVEPVAGESQTVAGALLALTGFAVANAIQKLWRLAVGWLLIAGGVWLATATPDTPLLWAGMAVGAVGAALVLWAFVVRYRQVRG